MGLQIYDHGNAVANILPLQWCRNQATAGGVANMLPQQRGHKDIATAMGSQTVLGLQNYSTASIGVTYVFQPQYGVANIDAFTKAYQVRYNTKHASNSHTSSRHSFVSTNDAQDISGDSSGNMNRQPHRSLRLRDPPLPPPLLQHEPTAVLGFDGAMPP